MPWVCLVPWEAAGTYPPEKCQSCPLLSCCHNQPQSSSLGGMKVVGTRDKKCGGLWELRVAPLDSLQGIKDARTGILSTT